MRFLHWQLSAGPQDTIEVCLDKQANVRLMDSHNFMNFRARRGHRFLGGRALRTPVRLRPPYYGNWHLVVDLGGYAGRVRAGVQVI